VPGAHPLMGFVAIGVLSLTIWQKIDIPLSFVKIKILVTNLYYYYLHKWITISYYNK